MRICFLDFETFWSTTHSLTKINPIIFVMHPETEIQSVAIAFNDYPTDVIFGEAAIRHAFSKIDWSDTMIVAHNNIGFDALICAWRFGLKPKAWGCTLSMARPFYALTTGVSLKRVAEAMGLEAKGSLDAVDTKGKKLAQFTPEEKQRMTVYNKLDTELCRKVFKGLVNKLGKHELKLIDMAIRMMVEPVLEADIPLLERTLQIEIVRKDVALSDLANVVGVRKPGMTLVETAEAMRPIIMSQPKFAGLLTLLGAKVPMKESTTLMPDGSVKMIPALAKTDVEMQALTEDPNPLVAMAASTRLEVKSSQLETRLDTFIKVAKVLGGKLPFPVNYCGAAISWRFSGSMAMNMQNMPRVDENKPKPSDALRHALVAPESKIIVVVDSANIELRVAHALAGSMDVLGKLRSGEDLYCWFASNLFGRVITKKDKVERMIGKVAMLSLQYGASWVSFQNMVRVYSSGEVVLPDDECKRVVNLWRAMFPAIADKKTGIWKKCNTALVDMAAGLRTQIDELGLCTTDFERINTPENHWLQYPTLRQTIDAKGYKNWKYGEGRNTNYIHGSKAFENICQHLARLIVMEQTLRVHKVYPVCITAHDEAGMAVNEGQEDDCKALALKEFSTSPAWWPDLPLDAEAGIGYTYAEAK